MMTDQTRELNTGFELVRFTLVVGAWGSCCPLSLFLQLKTAFLKFQSSSALLLRKRQTKKCWHHGEVQWLFLVVALVTQIRFPTHIIYEYSIPQNSGLRAPQNSGLRIKCQWLNDHEYMLGWLGHHRFRYPLPPSTCLHGACLRKWGYPKMSLVLAGKMTTTIYQTLSKFKPQ